MARRKRGRKSLFTPERREVIAKALSSGATVKDACDLAGIGVSTFHEWVAIGEAHIEGKKHSRAPHRIAEREEFAEFADTIKKARTTQRIRAVTSIVRAGQERWVHKKTGTIRTSPPPPVTWFNAETGELELEDDPRTYDPKGAWERQYSGEAWKHETGAWQAHAWYLERSDPESWGRKRVEVTGKDEGPIQIADVTSAFESLSNDELRAIAGIEGGGKAEDAV